MSTPAVPEVTELISLAGKGIASLAMANPEGAAGTFQHAVALSVLGIVYTWVKYFLSPFCFFLFFFF